MSRLDAYLGYWLRYVSNQVSHALGLKLEEMGITVAEWVMLRELYDGDRRPSALAEKLGLTRGAISKLTERLVAKRMITQQASVGDGRGWMLGLTDLGRAVVATVATLADQNEEEFFGGLDRHTREVIFSAMREILRRRGLRTVPAD